MLREREREREIPTHTHTLSVERDIACRQNDAAYPDMIQRGRRVRTPRLREILLIRLVFVIMTSVCLMSGGRVYKGWWDLTFIILLAEFEVETSPETCVLSE